LYHFCQKLSIDVIPSHRPTSAVMRPVRETT
jgi:hypothetical protein